MTMDIIFQGWLRNLFVIQRSKRFFSSSKYICRNNVYVDIQKNNTFHIKKNAIHVSLSSDDVSNIQDVCGSLNDILKGSFVGVKTSDDIYAVIKNGGTLTGLRM